MPKQKLTLERFGGPVSYDESRADRVVEVIRDAPDGQVMSQIREDPPKLGKFVVIDRQNGRMHDQNTIISRAKSLAELMGLRYVEDLRWPCVADRKLPCRCPECTGAVGGVRKVVSSGR